MDALMSTIVTLVQLVLGGFVVWGAWLVFRSMQATAPRQPRAQADDFERVASLVLLALLCTTVVGVA